MKLTKFAKHDHIKSAKLSQISLCSFLLFKKLQISEPLMKMNLKFKFRKVEVTSSPKLSF